ncbi:histidine kinase [Amycolatopsis mediterranei]|uniref:sensor histidine kinase n=1 Tax=Amycolatopsis mediterranei TaxID=33910 RepID=UPI00342265EE
MFMTGQRLKRLRNALRAGRADPDRLQMRLARRMMWIALGLVFSIRVEDGVTSHLPWPSLLLAMAPYPALIAILGGWYRRRTALLALVTILYAVPFPIVGMHWSWLPWPVAVAVLCVLPGRAAWPLFGLVVAGTVTAGFLNGDIANTAIHRGLSTTIDGLIFFGLSSLVAMVARLQAARSELARLATIRERLRVDGELRTVVGDSLLAIAEQLERATPGDIRACLRDVVDSARRTLAEIRATAGAYRVSETPSACTLIESPRLARGVLLGVLLAELALQTEIVAWGFHDPAALVVVLPVLIAAAVIVLRPPSRTSYLVLCLLSLPAVPGVFFMDGLDAVSNFWGFFIGVTLLRYRPPRSWVITVLVLAASVPLDFWPLPGENVVQATGDVASLMVMAWLTYSLARLADLVVLLEEAGRELTESAVAGERSRIARDLHDILGFSLSALALNGELCLRLLDIDPARARTEFAALPTLARRAFTELGSVVNDRIGLLLTDELAAARDVLAAAGIEAVITVDTGPRGAELDTDLAAALRESITNVLRHSNARTCRVEITSTGGAVRLRVVNDGAPAGRGSVGSGLAGLAERGRSRITGRHLPGERFELVAEFESEPARLGRDPDGVDPVPAA